MNSASASRRLSCGESPAAHSKSRVPRAPTARAPRFGMNSADLPGAIADGSDGRIACDHYNRLEMDFDLIAGAGRGSVSLLDFLAANPADRIRRSARNRHRFLRSPGRRAARARALNPLPLCITGTCRLRCSANTTAGQTGARLTDSRNTPRWWRSDSAIACAPSRRTTNPG